LSEGKTLTQLLSRGFCSAKERLSYHHGYTTSRCRRAIFHEYSRTVQNENSDGRPKT